MDQAEWRFDTKTYFSSRPSTRGIISALLATPVMDKRERLRTLAAKLAAIEQDRHAELAAGEGGSEPIDARAEARALAAVYDFLRDCKISHTDSVLRILERYLRPS
jgi:hypothetical protein